jgi:hypothetical protein
MFSHAHRHLRHVEHLSPHRLTSPITTTQPPITPTAPSGKVPHALVGLSHLRHVESRRPVLLAGPAATTSAR